VGGTTEPEYYQASGFPHNKSIHRVFDVQRSPNKVISLLKLTHSGNSLKMKKNQKRKKKN